MFPKNKIVRVEWEDASFSASSYNKDKPEETDTAMSRSVGYLIENNRRIVKLGFEIFDNGEIRRIEAIPKGMIRKITYLKEG